jgi:hypothetical protein
VLLADQLNAFDKTVRKAWIVERRQANDQCAPSQPQANEGESSS